MNYTDEFLNYWGEIYCRAQLVEYKLPFATFIKDPWKWILPFGVDDAKLPQLRDKPLTRPRFELLQGILLLGLALAMVLKIQPSTRKNPIPQAFGVAIGAVFAAQAVGGACEHPV
jgi:hypothetical protein